jgi:hypothetical protein
MKESESSNASTSGATSTSGPSPTERQKDKETKTSSATSEADYLAQQAADAQAAMAQAWADLKHSLATGVDVKKWTGRYPWIATGTALAAGVAAGYMLTPRDRDEAAEMWEKLKAKLSGSGQEENAVYVEAANGKPAQAPQQNSSLLGTIAKEAMKSLMPMITSMLGGAIGGGQAQQPDDADQHTT